MTPRARHFHYEVSRSTGRVRGACWSSMRRGGRGQTRANVSWREHNLAIVPVINTRTCLRAPDNFRASSEVVRIDASDAILSSRMRVVAFTDPSVGTRLPPPSATHKPPGAALRYWYDLRGVCPCAGRGTLRPKQKIRSWRRAGILIHTTSVRPVRARDPGCVRRVRLFLTAASRMSRMRGRRHHHRAALPCSRRCPDFTPRNDGVRGHLRWTRPLRDLRDALDSCVEQQSFRAIPIHRPRCDSVALRVPGIAAHESCRSAWSGSKPHSPSARHPTVRFRRVRNTLRVRLDNPASSLLRRDRSPRGARLALRSTRRPNTRRHLKLCEKRRGTQTPP